MAQSPEAWDYTLSDIPSPLTDEMEAAQQSKKVCGAGLRGGVIVYEVGLWLQSFTTIA
jgi:hypothetical protein